MPSRQEFQLLYVQDPHGVLNSFLVIPEPKPDAWAQDQRQGQHSLNIEFETRDELAATPVKGHVSYGYRVVMNLG